MNEELIETLIFPGKQIAVPDDEWNITKLEYSTELRPCNPSVVVRVRFAESGDGQVLVSRPSYDEPLEHDSAVL